MTMTEKLGFTMTVMLKPKPRYYQFGQVNEPR
jgi:hypothetical protein